MSPAGEEKKTPPLRREGPPPRSFFPLFLRGEKREKKRRVFSWGPIYSSSFSGGAPFGGGGPPGRVFKEGGGTTNNFWERVFFPGFFFLGEKEVPGRWGPFWALPERGLGLFPGKGSPEGGQFRRAPAPESVEPGQSSRRKPQFPGQRSGRPALEADLEVDVAFVEPVHGGHGVCSATSTSRTVRQLPLGRAREHDSSRAASSRGADVVGVTSTATRGPIRTMSHASRERVTARARTPATQ